MSDKNLLALIDNPKPFIIPVFPCLASSSLVPSEHFVQKDFPFYKVAPLTYFEVRQVRLEEWERKRQERTLRQALVAGCSSSSSAVHPPTENKKESIARSVRRVITTKKQHILENNSHEFHIF